MKTYFKNNFMQVENTISTVSRRSHIQVWIDLGPIFTE